MPCWLEWLHKKCYRFPDHILGPHKYRDTNSKRNEQWALVVEGVYSVIRSPFYKAVRQIPLFSSNWIKGSQVMIKSVEFGIKLPKWKSQLHHLLTMYFLSKHLTSWFLHNKDNWYCKCFLCIIISCSKFLFITDTLPLSRLSFCTGIYVV